MIAFLLVEGVKAPQGGSRHEAAHGQKPIDLRP